MLLFTAIFSIIFINIYRPFDAIFWKDQTPTQFFLNTLLIVVTAMIILVVSRWIMYKTKDRYPLNYWQLLFWMLIEILLGSLALSFLVKYVFGGIDIDFIKIYYSATLYTALVLFLPYSLSSLYFALREAQKRINQITEEESLFEVVSDKNTLIHFRDEKDKLRLSVRLQQILYLQASDNYIEIHYENKGMEEKFILRNTMKTMNNQYTSSYIVRCHRSFIINMMRVKMLRKDKEGIFLVLDIDHAVEIPVSGTYTKQIMEIIAR